MVMKSISVAKITNPKVTDVLIRKRLFQIIDANRTRPIIWMSSPAGAGKTTLVASYLAASNLPSLWYQMDEGDSDPATFFYYLRLAVKQLYPKKYKSLPLFTPEYFQGVSIFAKRYFEILYNTLKPPCSIVFDNYQDVPANSLFHAMIVHGLDIIPEGINVIIVSRNELHPAYARLYANNKISAIGWDEIRFTITETREIAKKKYQRTISAETIQQLHTSADGWIAGILLMAESAKKGSVSYQSGTASTHKLIFDYFAGEILEKMEKTPHDFLLRTSFLPKMTVKIAEKVSGIPQSAQILSELSGNNYFTTAYFQVETFYQYHPLFKEFLQSRARSVMPSDELFMVQRNSAEALKESGLIEDAALLFIAMKDWHQLIQIVIQHAQSLVAHGRNKTLEEWIASIPGEIRESTPWLLYWFGICRFLYNNPAESRTYFDKAFEQFRAQGDFTGIWLSWAYAVDTFFHEFDNFSPFDSYIQIFEELIQQRPVFPSPEIEFRVISCRFICMMLRQPDHPEIKMWAERVFTLLQKCSDVNLCLQTGFYLAVHYVCIGDFFRAGILIDLLRKRALSETAIPLMRLLEKTVEVFYSLNTGSSGLCVQRVYEALAYAHETGVHVWDNHVLSTGACAALNDGDVDTATQLLRKIEPGLAMARKIDVGFYHHISAMKEMLMGNLSLAAEHIQINVRILSEINAHFALTLGRITMSHVYAALGKYPEAVAQLALARQIGLWMKSKHIEYMCLLTEAYFALDLGIKGVDELSNAETSKHLPFFPVYDKCKESAGESQLPRSPFVKVDAGDGIEILRRAMALGREQNFIGCFIWRFDIMPRLCMKALEAGIEVTYVQHLIRERQLIPEEPALDCENWPYPLKVYTLGQFRIERDGKPVNFSGKVQEKPFAMLKAIISLGGNKISVEKLSDFLWHDAEGDVARISFKTTLHRLRRLLGNEKVLQMEGGQVSIDLHFCWVDVMAFRYIFKKVEHDIGNIGGEGTELKIQNKHTLQQIIYLAEKAMKIYRGNFIPGDAKQPWTVSLRERLRGNFVRLVDIVEHCYALDGKWDKVVEAYQKAIEVDELQEEFYKRLMVVYRLLERNADALATYKRCHTILTASLGIEPSPDTKAIYRKILEYIKDEQI